MLKNFLKPNKIKVITFLLFVGIFSFFPFYEKCKGGDKLDESQISGLPKGMKEMIRRDFVATEKVCYGRESFFTIILNTDITSGTYCIEDCEMRRDFFIVVLILVSPLILFFYIISCSFHYRFFEKASDRRLFNFFNDFLIVVFLLSVVSFLFKVF